MVEGPNDEPREEEEEAQRKDRRHDPDKKLINNLASVRLKV